jgi:hypothetical protein
MNSTNATKSATSPSDTFSRITAEHDVSEIFATALDVVKAAAQQRDPSIVDWHVQTAVDDEADVAFALTGTRKPRAKAAAQEAPSEFPLPHPGNSPAGDLAIALDVLRVVAERLASDEPLPRESVIPLLCVLSCATDKLEPVLGYLESDTAPPRQDAYLAARRAWVIAAGGRQS